MLPFEQLKSVGANAITLASGQGIQPTGKDGLRGLGTVASLKVADEAGTFIGVVDGVEIDEGTGRIVQLTTQKGGILGLGGTTAMIPAAPEG